MKNAVVFSRPVKNKDMLDFFVSLNGEEHWLFRHKKAHWLNDRFGAGVYLDDALGRQLWLKHPSAHKELRTHFLRAVKYVEKEYGMPLLRRTRNSRRPRFTEERGEEAA